jgi:hypothetical protein
MSQDIGLFLLGSYVEAIFLRRQLAREPRLVSAKAEQLNQPKKIAALN